MNQIDKGMQQEGLIDRSFLLYLACWRLCRIGLTRLM